MDFYSNTITNHPKFSTNERVSDLNMLEPVTRSLVQKIVSKANEDGHRFMVFETYRSRERQRKLFEQGVTQLKDVGVHHYGLACDIVRVVNGNPSWDGDFSEIGRLARQYGLIWGGDWQNFKDVYHVQRCSMKRQKQLFQGTWYPDEYYNPYND